MTAAAAHAHECRECRADIPCNGPDDCDRWQGGNDGCTYCADAAETWADPGHDCDDIPCPTYGDDCAWNLAQDMRARAAELAS